MKINSKAETLKKLNLKYSTIPKLEIFKCEDYLLNKDKILFTINRIFGGKLVAIRSSFQMKIHQQNLMLENIKAF